MDINGTRDRVGKIELKQREGRNLRCEDNKDKAPWDDGTFPSVVGRKYEKYLGTKTYKGQRRQ